MCTIQSKIFKVNVSPMYENGVLCSMMRALNRFRTFCCEVLLHQELPAAKLFAHVYGIMSTNFRNWCMITLLTPILVRPMHWHKCAYFERLSCRNGCTDYDFVLHVLYRPTDKYRSNETCDEKVKTWLVWYQNNYVLTSKYTTIQRDSTSQLTTVTEHVWINIVSVKQKPRANR